MGTLKTRLLKAHRAKNRKAPKIKDEDYITAAKAEAKNFWSIYADAIFEWRKHPQWRDIANLNGLNQHRQMFYRPGEWDAFIQSVEEAYLNDPRTKAFADHDRY